MPTPTAAPADGPRRAYGAAVDEPVTLPRAARERVLALASERLGALPPEQVPPSLVAFRRFTPSKRARLAAGPLAAALEGDAAFRTAVAEGVRSAQPDLAAALSHGRPPPAAAPEDVAALAYLLRPEGWQQLLEHAATEIVQRAGEQAADAHLDAVTRLTEQLDALRAAAKAEAARLTQEAADARAELAVVARKVRAQGEQVARAEAACKAAEREAEAVRVRAAAAAAAHEVELREARARVAEAEAVVVAAKQAAREGRSADELRLRVLLDALLGAAQGLRRELALPPAEGRIADAIAADYDVTGDPYPSAQGRAVDDPVLLDALLGVPGTHLMVDGYNVTKGGYGTLPLEAQRSRLLGGLGALAARTQAEVTVVFDGADRVMPLAVASPRGVRLLFSRAGETADEVLRRLARLEPPGRPVVVVSSDREVADGVRRSGARPVASAALLRLLDR